MIFSFESLFAVIGFRIQWEKLLTKTDHQGPVFSFSFSRDDAFMISGGGHDDPTLRKWNAAHFKEMAIIGRCKMDIHNMALSADETVLVTARNTVHLWDMEWGPVTELEGHTIPVYQAVFSSAGELLATAGAPGLLIVWDVNRKKFGKKSSRIKICRMFFSWVWADGYEHETIAFFLARTIHKENMSLQYVWIFDREIEPDILKRKGLS